MNGRVLVVCASRGRPDRLARMAESIKQTSTHADLCVYIDDDQQEMYAQVEGDFIKCVGPRIGQCASLNHVIKQMDGYEAYGAATDDSVFETPGWDQWVLKTAGEFPGGIGMISPSSGAQERRMDFPWATRNWIEAVGSFTGPPTHHSYWDVAMQLVGESTAIKFATADEFRMGHEQLEFGSQSDEKSMNAFARMTYMLYHVHNDARIVCLWIATERHAVIERVRKAIEASQ